MSSVSRCSAYISTGDDWWPVTPMWRTADWAYVRFHVGNARPRPCYGRRALASWVERLTDLWGDDVDGYAYFNNDTNGCAVRDANVFAEFARRAGHSVSRTPPPATLGAGGRLTPAALG